MKRIAMAAAGLLIASFVCPGTPRAQPSVPEKAPKLTLSGVEAQVVTLQAQVATLQTTLNALHPPRLCGRRFGRRTCARKQQRRSRHSLLGTGALPGQFQQGCQRLCVRRYYRRH